MDDTSWVDAIGLLLVGRDRQACAPQEGERGRYAESFRGAPSADGLAVATGGGQELRGEDEEEHRRNRGLCREAHDCDAGLSLSCPTLFRVAVSRCSLRSCYLVDLGGDARCVKLRPLVFASCRQPLCAAAVLYCAILHWTRTRARTLCT